MFPASTWGCGNMMFVLFYLLLNLGLYASCMVLCALYYDAVMHIQIFSYKKCKLFFWMMYIVFAIIDYWTAGWYIWAVVVWAPSEILLNVECPLYQQKILEKLLTWVLIYDGICESLFEGRYLLYYGPFGLCRDLKRFGDSCLDSRAGVDDVLCIPSPWSVAGVDVSDWLT